MYYDKIKLKNKIELPGQKDVTPTTFDALERNRDSEGGFARTLQERFPFGLVAKSPPKAFRFNWGEENFAFLGEMLLSDERIHDIFKEWAGAKAMAQLLLNRDLTKEKEAEIRDGRMYDLAYYLKTMRTRKHFDRLDMYYFYFQRYLKQYDTRAMRFTREGIEKAFQRADLKKYYETKARNNPHDSRLEWPAEPSVVVQKRFEYVDHNTERWLAARKELAEQDRNITTQINKLEKLAAEHSPVYKSQFDYALKIVDPRPDRIKWGRRIWNHTDIGIAEPGQVLFNKFPIKKP